MLSSEDAQTDVILAAATVIFGVNLRAFITSFAWYPQAATQRRFLDLLWVMAVTAVVPLLLARYRKDKRAAFGVRGAGIFLEPMLLIPAVGVVAVTFLLLPGILTTPQAVFGRATTVVGLLETLALGLGAFLLITFLSVRANVAYPRSPQMPLKQLVRTTLVIAIAVTLVFGLLRALGPRPTGTTAVFALIYTVTLLLLLWLTDRAIPFGATVSRATMLAPVLVVVAAHLFSTGGLFRGDLLTGGYLAAIATGPTLLLACRSHLPRGSVAVLPFMLAIHLWPTCLSPLALPSGYC